jgi:thioesterase domain-containing protein
MAGKLAYLASRLRRRAKWEVQRRYIDFRRWSDQAAFDLLERFNRPVPPYLRQRRLLELNGRLNDGYHPRPYQGRSILIRGAYPDAHFGSDFGWNKVIAPAVATRLMDTEDHLQMLTEPNLLILVNHLQEAFAAVEAAPTEA